MRRTGKQGLHERVKQGEAIKLQRIRARRMTDLQQRIAEGMEDQEDLGNDLLWEDFMSHELSLEQEADRLQKLQERTDRAILYKAQNNIRARGESNGEDNRGPCEICKRRPMAHQRSNHFDR